MNPRSSMDLSKDVVFQILVKLPVRSLVRFRLVCKDWCSLINSCGFKNAYLALRRAMAVDDKVVRVNQVWFNYNASNIAVTRWFDDFKTIGALSALTDPYSSVIDNSYEFELSGIYIDRLSFVNHVDGIVCLISGDNHFDITLVNPALRETRKFHIPTLNFGGVKCYLQCGFGYGINGNDVIEYKVVAIVTVYEEEGFTSGLPSKHIALVYYLSTNSWKILGDMSAFVPPFVSLVSEETVFSHGSIHWCMQISRPNDPQDAILAFDMTNESFRVIHFPSGWKYYTHDDEDAMYPHLFSVDKSTIALVYATHQLCADHVQQQIQIWVMKEYGDRDSWTLQYSINTLPRLSHVICFWKKDKLLISPRVDGSLMFYDLLKGQLDEETEHPGDVRGYLVTGHETLVSVKQV